MTKKFLRTGTKRYKKLGKNRRKKEKWRRARGRDNKIREKRKGRLKKVEIGFRTNKSERGKIEGKIPVFVENLKQVEKIKKGDVIIIRRVGKKKRREIEKKIKEKGGRIILRGKNEPKKEKGASS